MQKGGTKRQDRDEGTRGRALLAHLRASLPSMRNADRTIAECVLDDPERVVTTTIAELSRTCKVSEGSIVGFCQRLELKGFTDFKIALARDLAETGFPGRRAQGKGTLLENVINFHVECLEDVLKVNREEAFTAAVTALNKARRIEFFSMGISYPVAYSAAAKFTLIGMPAFTQSDSHMQLITATQVGKGDVAFGVSCSGATRETINCLEVARGNGATTICITNAMASPITTVSDICLHATPSEIRYFQAPLASRITQLALIDALFVALAQKSKRKTGEQLQRTGEELIKYR